MTTFGIIGAGDIGRNLSIAPLSAGHQVAIATAHGPQTLAGLIADLRAGARAATADELRINAAAAQPLEVAEGKVMSALTVSAGQFWPAPTSAGEQVRP
ncbi:NAD(P)-binding domain-containing protein [Actinoplanes sp. N902-109]|uniref:NAD(P)-binding domain-containing protein n=1 Tax=Actinoplanes sp. (strain N902-109) TaxID=649831 RepID=UPI000329432B|nr:NAD(P)-binding domain-containing protein [Actinoplanes sp. N902-109]AGL16337.1 hypothetical protein L083_2827 [Actinoplanes sp. N902-109]